MSITRVARSTALVALCTLLPATAAASFPAGVWGLVEGVTFEPDMKNPTRVRIDGLFIVANQMPDFPAYPGYAEPVYGYMYYECPADQLATCALEWADLAAAAMSDNHCRGWGDNTFPDNGAVRPPVQPAMAPDVYPISMGVLMGFSPCEALKQWMIDHPPPPVEDTSGGADSSGGPDTTGDATGTSGSTGAPATGGDTTGDPGTSGASATAGATGGAVTSEGGGTSGTSGALTSDGGAGGTSGAPETGGGDKAEGCACQTGGPGSSAMLALAVLAPLVRRRRRS